MNIHELKLKFKQKRNYSTDNLIDLMNFAKMTYILNEISIKEYRQLVRELESLGVDTLGAETPEDENTLIETN
ncbi:YppF family protein [Neobacillus sp. D3-1R]|uniref:YppF family protein n=1 Tax=Neobacillus sp. D3-1R TaxID=3445778 RepID=UPI003FA12969